jgi:hypothetical protein
MFAITTVNRYRDARGGRARRALICDAGLHLWWHELWEPYSVAMSDEVCVIWFN